MVLPDLDLFSWWAISITGGSVFLTLVSIYLYTDSRAKRKEEGSATKKRASVLRGFIFVWVLLSLLVFYIISIKIGSAAVFAVGNILVEALLIVYLIKNTTKSTEQT